LLPLPDSHLKMCRRSPHHWPLPQFVSSNWLLFLKKQFSLTWNFKCPGKELRLHSFPSPSGCTSSTRRNVW
jgi:hypothetical protein